jgi:hypothetical protein
VFRSLILYLKVLDNVQGSSSSYVSPVWNFFEKDPKDETKAQCKICSSMHNRTGSSTSNLIKVLCHIFRHFYLVNRVRFNFLFSILCST